MNRTENNSASLSGLIAAPFTPFQENGKLDTDIISLQAEFLRKNGVSGVFICGTTGEGMSLTVRERIQMTEAWSDLTDETFRLIVHVGHNCLKDARCLAEQAEKAGAAGIGAIAPHFFRPAGITDLVEWCGEIAAAAPTLPFYYYHIPAMTGVNFLMYQFLPEAGKQIPNFAGVKFTHENLFDFARCLEIDSGRFDVLFGRDEILLSALLMGASGAVGSFYNYLAPAYCKIFDYVRDGNIDEAEKLQSWIRQFCEIYFKFGGTVAIGKAVQKIAGLNCGPVRLPLRDLPEDRFVQLKTDLESINFYAYSNKNQ